MITDAMKKHGAFSWNELMTNDLAGAKAFYGELLGWTLEDIESSCGGYTMARAGNTEVAGMIPTPATAEGMPSAWGAYVTVDNVDAIAERVAKLGGKVCMAAQDIPDVGRFIVIQDPQGAVLMLISYINKGM